MVKLDIFKQTSGAVSVSCLFVRRTTVPQILEEIKAVLMSALAQNADLLDALHQIISIQCFLKINKCSLFPGTAQDLEHKLLLK
jgi:hypothetical protein